MRLALSTLLGLAVICGGASAQITQIPGASLISPVVIDFDTGAPPAGIITGNDAYWASFGLCNVAIINNPGVHTAGGDVLSSGLAPLTNCLASVGNTLAIVAPGGAMDNQGAGAGWAFRLAPGTIATQFGCNIADQVNHQITVETWAGNALQNTFTFTMTGGFPNPDIYFEDLFGFDEVRFISTAATGGWGIDNLTFANVVGTAGACPPPPSTPFQVNQTNANLDIDGIQTSGFSPAVTSLNLNTPGTLTIASPLAGTGFETVINLGALIPNALTTPNQQTLNMNLAGALWLNGGAAPLILPFPGTIAIPVSAPTPIVASAQSVFVDPSNLDFFSLSQGVQLEVVADPQLGPGDPTCTAGSTPLTLADDAVSQQGLGFAFNFYGTSYSTVFVGSNGHCTFGAGTSTGWAGGGAALNNNADAMIAICSEDFNPTLGGTVSFFTDNVGQFEACWAGISSFGAVPANSNDFRIQAFNGVAITFDYGVMQEVDGTVGMSAGGGLNTELPLNLSAAGGVNGPIAIPAGSTPFEDFVGNLDLSNLQILWGLDPMGTPISIQ